MRTVRPVATADLLLHPVRLRIVQAFLGGRELTTTELGADLDDVPSASLYRHVGLLADAGVLAVAEERKVRGAAERRYRLVLEAASADPAGMSAEDHRRAFATFVAALLADFDRYLDRAGQPPDLLADGVGYRQAGLWLDDEELAAFLGELRALVADRMARPQRAGRRRRILSTVLMPGD
jgi:DNA-binding transcriptional ArsR family regulator